MLTVKPCSNVICDALGTQSVYSAASRTIVEMPLFRPPLRFQARTRKS